MTPLETMLRCRDGEFAVSISGYHERPQTLLEACCLWTGQQGGTIWMFLPRLKWVYSHRENRTSVHHLELDGMPIGTAFGPKKELPPIGPNLMPGYLDYIPKAMELMS